MKDQDERKKRVEDAMQRYFEKAAADAAAGIQRPLICWKCPCKLRKRMMCENKQAELTLHDTTDPVTK